MKLVTPKEILTNPNEAYIVGALNGCIGQGDKYRADIASILITRLINFTLLYAEGHPIDQKIIDRLTRLLTDPDIITDDLKYILVKKILNGAKQKFQKLLLNTEIVKMSLK